MVGIRNAFRDMKNRMKKDENVEILPVTPEKEVMMFDAVNWIQTTHAIKDAVFVLLILVRAKQIWMLGSSNLF